MKRMTKAALAAASISVFSAAQLYQYVFGREEPQLIRSLKKRRPNKNHGEEFYRRQQEGMLAARNTPHETLTDQTKRGHLVRGYLWKSPSPSKNAVAFLIHGYRSNAMETVGPFLSYYLSRGIDVFSCDHEAAGGSEGRFFSYDYFESEVCLSWLSYLVRRYGPEVSILLHGFSMGAATVLHMSDRCPPQVKFLVSDCGYTSGQDILTFQAGSKLLYPLLRAENRLVAGFDLEKTDVRPHLRRTDKPILFVHGTADPTVPYWMGQELYRICPTEKYLLTVEKGLHVESIYRERAAYEKMLDEFISKYL